jgi:hypothetical protein
MARRPRPDQEADDQAQAQQAQAQRTDQDLGRLISPPPLSREEVECQRTWSVYDQETHQDRASYDNAVDAARFARDQAYEQARRSHQDAIQQADAQFDEASTAAWKTYRSNTDTARRQRDERLDYIRYGITPELRGVALEAKEQNARHEIDHARAKASVQQQAQAQAADDGGYSIMRNADDTQFTRNPEGIPVTIDPETPAAPDDRAGVVTEGTGASNDAKDLGAAE